VVSEQSLESAVCEDIHVPLHYFRLLDVIHIAIVLYHQQSS